MTEKNKEKYPINFKFYQFIFSILKNDIVRKTKTGTSKEAINRKNFSNYEISYIDIKHQNLWENKLTNVNNSLENINVETENQANYLKKLRQSILQEAIEGKLTADWRKQNPVQKGNPEYDAEALLEKIKIEKEKLIKEKKIKKPKPLPPIKPDEIPFELPKGWKWTRLGELCDFITKGTTPPNYELLKKAEIPYLKVYNIVNRKINFDYKPQFIRREIHEQMLRRSRVYPNDVLMNIVGPPLGKIAIVPADYPEWNINQAIAIFRTIEKEMFNYIYYFLCEGAPIRTIELKGVVGQDNISLTQSRELVIALPPFLEQKAIISKVKKSLAVCDMLEEQVTERQKQAKQLMQSVLKEAFNNNN